jgi:tetratricopeptide (TPR) repeat protein
MNKNVRFYMLAVAALALFSSVGCDKLRARDQLNKGVEAYKNSHFEEAAQHFQKASELDANLLNAHMYLAGAFVAQYVPGADTPDNVHLAEQAIEQYQHVLDAKPGREQQVTALSGIAGLYCNLNKFDQSKKFYRMVSEIDPNNPEPYYSIGVMDWASSFKPRMDARATLGLKPEEHLNAKNKDQKKVCDDMKAKNMPSIQEGMDSLNKAIELRPDYDDAMAYLNLIYRERADIECDDLATREQDLKQADHWVDQAMQAKQARAAKAAQNATGGITVDQPK